MEKKYKKAYVIKIGGNIIDDDAMLSSFLKEFAAIKENKILVHGGGKLATRVAEAMGISQQMINGRRITDAETLKVVTMVYAGYINKNMVAKLQSFGCNAIGLCGADANIIQAHKRIHPTIDYGFAGDIDSVDTGFLQILLKNNITPILAPVTHDENGLLNTNADTIAKEVASAMSGLYKVQLIYCFEKNGVLMDAVNDKSIIAQINETTYNDLKNKKIISGGMIPKLDNSFDALKSGVEKVIIGSAENLHDLIHHRTGTAIVYE